MHGSYFSNSATQQCHQEPRSFQSLICILSHSWFSWQLQVNWSIMLFFFTCSERRKSPSQPHSIIPSLQAVWTMWRPVSYLWTSWLLEDLSGMIGLDWSSRVGWTLGSQLQCPLYAINCYAFGLVVPGRRQNLSLKSLHMQSVFLPPKQ